MSNRADKSHARIESSSLRLKEALLFSALLATLFFLFRGYSYGTGDHVEQLPMIYRLLDASYCSNDFFVNASMRFGPRTYYSRVLALLGSSLPLPVVFLALTWLANFGIALVTYLAAKDLFEGSELVGMLACVFVMGATGARLGGSGDLTYVGLLPSFLVFPLVLLSLWASIRGRAIICAVLAAGASVIHPLVGLEAGAIGLATVGLSVFLDPGKVDNPKNRTQARKIVAVFVGACVLGAAALILWVGKQTTSLGTNQFVDIVARFRHPHHYLPSTWSTFSYVKTACILFTFAVSWKWWRDELSRNRVVVYSVLIIVLIILLLWCGGYVFVEVFPARLWTTAQTFRLVFILNWFAFIMIAGTIARVFGRKSGSGKACGRTIRVGSGSTLPIFAFFGHIVDILRKRMRTFFPKNIKNIAVALLFLISVQYSSAVPAFIAIAVWFLLLPARWYRSFVPLLVLCVLVCGIAVDMYYRIPVLWRVMYKVNSRITTTRRTYFEDEVALYARKATPETVVFLTPPNFGRFRLTARRAIVVDFKAFPFQDNAMLEWRTRLQDCYGSAEKTGFPAAREMDANYRSIPEQRLLMLARKYYASYAVLYSDTHCELPVLFKNRHYKLVRVDSGNWRGRDSRK